MEIIFYSAVGFLVGWGILTAATKVYRRLTKPKPEHEVVEKYRAELGEKAIRYIFSLENLLTYHFLKEEIDVLLSEMKYKRSSREMGISLLKTRTLGRVVEENKKSCSE